ncbi:MAG: hypothetical protein ACI8RZ_005156 [Myxococcota bacterium]|jgi:hypothetical protein
MSALISAAPWLRPSSGRRSGLLKLDKEGRGELAGPIRDEILLLEALKVQYFKEWLKELGKTAEANQKS